MSQPLRRGIDSYRKTGKVGLIFCRIDLHRNKALRVEKSGFRLFAALG